jgi:Rieske Fe-S protein
MSDKPKDGGRREFLDRASTLAMATGLVAGYGSCTAAAVRYVYPEAAKMVRLFVSDLGSFTPGTSLRFETPNGKKLAITRHGKAGGADDFIALSSTCPHLGCQVHWQQKEARFFCPCHNGTFDPRGAPTGGPPKSANTPLLRYPLVVDRGLLYIELPEEELV